jgi:hypothetical protein
MSGWWTYSPSDFLLFSPQTYYRLFELYNRDVWPLQLAALGLGAAIAILVRRSPARHGRIVSAVLSVSWLWMAWAYHLRHYAAINWAAPWFGAVFAVEAVFLIWTGVIRDRLAYNSASPLFKGAGLAVFTFALVIHPLMGALLGRRWTQVEIFGIAPDPTAIATLGMLLSADHGTIWALLIIPAVWCAISAATLWAMGSPEAFVAPPAACVIVVLAVWKIRRERSGPH